MKPNAEPKLKQSYLYKAQWHSTALKFRVEAVDEAEAIRRAERTVKQMEGGVYCLGLELLNITESRERVTAQSR